MKEVINASGAAVAGLPRTSAHAAREQLERQALGNALTTLKEAPRGIACLRNLSAMALAGLDMALSAAFMSQQCKEARAQTCPKMHSHGRCKQRLAPHKIDCSICNLFPRGSGIFEPLQTAPALHSVPLGFRNEDPRIFQFRNYWQQSTF